MALYVPAGARRRRLILTVVAGLVVGLALGFVLGRSTAQGLGDRVDAVQAQAADAATALERIPIEYEQAVADAGGESTDTIRSAIKSAQVQLDEAYAEAIWFGSDARDTTDAAFAELQQAVDDGVPPDEFATLVDDAVAEIQQTFALSG